jgi:predicted esterase
LRRLTPGADRDGFAVLVPDSVEPGGWRVGDRPDDVTADRRHVMDCVSELLARPDVHVDRSRVLVAGFSAGGSSAPAIASHEEPFTAFAILHGGVVAGSFGPRHLRGWLSTGRGDTVRSVAQVQQAAAQLRAGGATDLEIQAFDGGHVLFDPEIDAMLAWWLG